MRPIALFDLTELAASVLIAQGTRPDTAMLVAQAVTGAEADGLSSHGVVRIPHYAAQVAAGKIDGQASPRIEVTAKAAVRVDACNGFAFPAIRLGIERALSDAPRLGVVGVGVANSHHMGVAGHHAERIATAGYVGLVFSNTPAAIAPWGGLRPLFGTNPIAFACPVAGRPPLVIDLSLSAVARGRIVVAAEDKESIPGDWALDKHGQPTTDPKAALQGSMLPLGGVKGAVLSMMVELLTAGLTGSNFGFEASSLLDAEGAPPGLGQFLLIIDPDAFSAGQFAERAATLVEAIVAQDGARLPGARRLAERDRSRKSGVQIPEQLYLELRRLA